MDTMTFLFSFLIFVAAAGTVQLPAAANTATAAAGILQQQAQHLQLLKLQSGATRELQALPGRKLLQKSTSAEERLLYFVRVGNIAAARRILAGGTTPSFQNEDGLSPLFVAITSNNKQMVQLLVEFGVQIYDLGFDQETGKKTDALHLASGLGATKVMKALLEAGVSPDKLDAVGLAALHAAVTKKQIGAATLLLDAGAAVDAPSQLTTPLFLAISIQDLKMVKLLISRGANVESLNTEAGLTPVVGAVFVNSVEFIQELIRAGANVNGTGRFQMTPIWFAVTLGNIGPMKVLIHNGADMSVQIGGKSLQESLCGCTTDPTYQNLCNFSACEDAESMEALLE